MTQAQTVSREPTMEEILASIRRIIEDGNSKTPELTPENDLALPSEAPAEVAAFSQEFAEADVFSKPVQAAVAQTIEVRAEPARLPTFDDMIADRDAAVAAPESAAVINVPAPASELRPIISEAASRQVAKSFEHLSVALSEERNTSVAQMTEEMLRPMLQDWLDNNLPTLVERLVREEIERVSRGAR